MKRLLFLLVAAMLLVACGNGEPVVEESSEQVEPKLELSETKVSFADFTIEIEEAEIKDNKLILKTRFTNDSYTKPTAFLAAAGLDVMQGEDRLKEVSGVMSDPNSNYFYKNDTGINAPVEFEYELTNETDDIEVTFVPTDWDQDSESIMLTIQ